MSATLKRALRTDGDDDDKSIDVAATLISNVGFEPIEPGPNLAPPGPVRIVMGQRAYEGDSDQS